MNAHCPHSNPADTTCTLASTLHALSSSNETILIQSPPGAGKTTLVQQVAEWECHHHAGRIMITTQTSEQAYDVARRMATGTPHHPLYLLLRAGRSVPSQLAALSNIIILKDSLQIPTGPCIVVANAARWSWVDPQACLPFALNIIDEAYQLADYRFQTIASLARRLLLVGDPGQIAPVIRGSITRWKNNLAGPHVPCPQALLTRDPSLSVLTIPTSRRLVPDTIAFLQPTFYPSLPFTAPLHTGKRMLLTCTPGTGTCFDQAIEQVEQGASLLLCELPPLLTGEHDPQLTQAVVFLVHALQTRSTLLIDEDGATYPLEDTMIGIVCTHRTQVGALRRALAAHPSILIETADCFQGLERPLIIALHPLSGRMEIDAFHADAGRFCVMLSRHRVACFLLSRAGVETRLRRNPPSGDRILGIGEDANAQAWNSHLTLLAALRRRQRVIPLG